jgi:hypothetical protein
MGGGGGQTSTSQSQPWKEQKPYLTYGFEQAQDQYKSNNPSYYQGSTVSPLSATTQQAMQLQTNRALNGNAATNAGQNQLTKTINGDYLNSNPYLDANFKAGSDAISSAYGDAIRGNTASFAGAGRTGSGMQAFYNNQQNDTLAKNLNNLYGQTYYNNYNTERGNQMNAINQAPQYAAQDYTNLDALSNVGAAQDANSQNVLNADIDRWNYNQNLDANKLQQYMGLVQGNYGGTSSTTTPSSGSNMFGNLLSVAGLGASFFSDKTLKENIEPRGTENGHNVYEFNYIGDGTKYIGVMAQEVEITRPDAVREFDGFKMVDYDAIGVQFREVE